MPTVLIIDDNPAVATALEMLFSLHDIDAVAARSPESGLARLRQGGIDLVVQDMNFHADTTSGDEGIALFHAIRGQEPDLPVILLTAWTHLESAVDLADAHELMSYLRLQHQVAQVRDGRRPDNHLDPESLSSLDRRHLRDAFQIVRQAQHGLSTRLPQVT